MQVINVLTDLATWVLIISILTVTPTFSSPIHNQTFLDRRAPPTLHISDCEITAVRDLSILLPISFTVQQLENFYTAVAFKARHDWLPSLMPAPILHFSIRWGALQLHFVSSKAEPPLPIPWEFVAEFADMMMQATRRGWTPAEYDQSWWNQARTWGIYVGLRIMSPGATPALWLPVSGGD